MYKLFLTKSVINILEENDIDVEDGTCYNYTTSYKRGKSVARINGMVVTLNILREISDRLINILPVSTITGTFNADKTYYVFGRVCR